MEFQCEKCGKLDKPSTMGVEDARKMGLDNVKSEPLAFQVTFIYEKDEPKVLWQCKDCGHLNNLPSQLKRAIGNS